jgi:hypothetical protein
VKDAEEFLRQPVEEMKNIVEESAYYKRAYPLLQQLPTFRANGAG